MVDKKMTNRTKQYIVAYVISALIIGIFVFFNGGLGVFSYKPILPEYVWLVLAIIGLGLIIDFALNTLNKLRNHGIKTNST